MPFGPDCQYEDFGACVKANSKKKNPRAYCAKIMKATEEHCAKKRAAQYVPTVPPPVEAEDEEVMPPRVGA